MLTLEQRIEMNDKIRFYNGTGNPQEAQAIKAALGEDRFYLGKDPEPVVEIEAPKSSAKKPEWVEYAKEVSDIDHEVIDHASKKDLVGMLKANGLTV